jgi:8-oxo-dGTP pyrophosphatase MutT (NUDIX family)
MSALMPIKPHPAATLVLIRDAAAVEVLLIQRHHQSRFAGGDFVFPGGKVELEDNPDDATAWCRGLTPESAALRLGLADARAAVAYWIGAIREAFEEVGVLLAYGLDGTFVQPSGPRYDEYRQACQEDNRAFWKMVRTERLTLATDRLVYFAHWITPEESPVRFDTRFFAVDIPPGQTAIADDREIIAVRWLTPTGALEARQRGEISLRFPTIKNLGLLEGGGCAAETLARLALRRVETIRPRLVVEGGTQRVLIPGDPGYF